MELNDYSTRMYEQLATRYDRHIKLMQEVRSDLQIVFKQLRVMRDKVSKTYPQAHRKVLDLYPPEPYEDDE
jgi:hypothetical protein